MNDIKLSNSLKIMNGHWVGIIYYKDDFGNYKQKQISTKLPERGNKKKAQTILNEATIEFQKELLEAGSNQNNSDEEDIIFIDWLNSYVDGKQNKLTPYVYKSYKSKVAVMKKFFGKKLKLKDVTYEHLNKFYDYLRDVRNNKNITIKHYMVIINPALKEASKKDLIVKNPAQFIEPLKREKSRFKYYNKDEIELFLDACKGHKAELALKVAAYYGFRRSELLGLKWESVDFNKKTITVEHKVLVFDKEVYASDYLKTSASYRILPLIEVIEKDLLEHKQAIEKNMMMYGNSYNKEYLDYVFVNEFGGLILPDFLTKSMQDIIKTNNLKKIRLHDLRHSCASLLLASGVQMKQIQEWLGHANFNTTADVYSHLDFDSKIDSATRISEMLDFDKGIDSKDDLEREIEELERQLESKKKKLKQSDIEM